MYNISSYRSSKSLILTDLIIFAISPFLACITRYVNLDFGFKLVMVHLIPFITANIIQFFVFFIGGMYYRRRDYRNTRAFLEMGLQIAVGFMLSTFLFYIFSNVGSVEKALYVGRGILGLNTVWILVLGFIARSIYSKQTAGSVIYRAAILGRSRQEQFIKEYLTENTGTGIEIIGDISVPGAGETPSPLATLDNIEEIIKDQRINLIIVALEKMTPEITRKLLTLGMMHIDIIDMPSFYEELTGCVPFDYINHEWLLMSLIEKPKFYMRSVKPVLDRCIAAAGLILSLPIAIPVALLVKLTSRGSVFYTQTRLGLHGEPYNIYKFRTMRADAEINGVQQTGERDSRIILLGKLIRKFRIDEIPQFWNVLRGEMSVVGPRPERPEFIEQYEKEIPFYRERLFVRPGITGWAQIHSGYAASSGETREKLLYDLYYIKNISFTTDLVILLRTVRIVLFHQGAK